MCSECQFSALRLGMSSQFPSRADPSLLEKISSRGKAVSETDHFGTKEIRDKSL
jgi:hypothetical protein